MHISTISTEDFTSLPIDPDSRATEHPSPPWSLDCATTRRHPSVALNDVQMHSIATATSRLIVNIRPGRWPIAVAISSKSIAFTWNRAAQLKQSNYLVHMCSINRNHWINQVIDSSIMHLIKWREYMPATLSLSLLPPPVLIASSSGNKRETRRGGFGWLSNYLLLL